MLKDLIDNVKAGKLSVALKLDNFQETAQMIFQQDTQFRTDQILCLDFEESDADTIKASISYRINFASQLNMLIQARLKDICKIVEQKNPTLLKEIRKGQIQTNGPGGVTQ